MKDQPWLSNLEEKIRVMFLDMEPGHDWEHIRRVRDLCLNIAKSEGGDPLFLECLALVHDVGDHKFGGNALEKITQIFLEVRIPYEISQKVLACVDKISFHGLDVPEEDVPLEVQILRDADRLDAIGAIGVARAFSFCGHKNLRFFNLDQSPVHHSSAEEYKKSKSGAINHFYEKLLYLHKRMHTKTARDIGEKRHRFLVLFLKEFFWEWDPLGNMDFSRFPLFGHLAGSFESLDNNAESVFCSRS